MVIFNIYYCIFLVLVILIYIDLNKYKQKIKKAKIKMSSLSYLNSQTRVGFCYKNYSCWLMPFRHTRILQLTVID